MRSIDIERSYFSRHSIVLVLLVAIALRAIISVLYGHETLYPDSEGYLDLAKRLINFDLAGYTGERSPGYPLLLALANLSNPAIVTIQFFIGMINLCVIYQICILLGMNKKHSEMLTLAICLYIPAIFFEYAILSETMTLLFMSLLFYLVLKILKSDKGKITNYLLLALTCGILVLIKPFYIFVGPILAILIYISKKKIILASSIFLFPTIIFLSWSTVNFVNTGYFTSTTFYGFNLAQNCVNFAENTSEEYKEIGETYAKYREANDTTDLEIAMTIWQAYPELQARTGLSFPDLSKKLFDYSIVTIKMNMADYAKQVFISWRDFWKTSLYWEYDNFAINGSNVVLKYICYAERILLQIIKIAFILLIPICIIRSVQQRKVSFQLIAITIIASASILQAMMTYGTNSRFSFPFEMIMVICVAWEIHLRFNKQKS